MAEDQIVDGLSHVISRLACVDSQKIIYAQQSVGIFVVEVHVHNHISYFRKLSQVWPFEPNPFHPFLTSVSSLPPEITL
jgi:hypothetical protein